MHLEILYVTRFLYPAPVWDSHNALRAKPADDEHQALLSYAVSVTPEASFFTYVDNWGTEVNEFSISDQHDELVVSARATVETKSREAPQDVEGSGLFDPSFRESHWSFLQPSKHIRWSPEMSAEAARAAGPDGMVADRIRSIAGMVSDRLAYTPGATEVGTSTEEVWARGEGVCQDFTHLTIGLLRSQGIPARYVSGYLYAADPASGLLDDTGEVVVQTHAWVEAAVPGFGWWAIDPTNDTVVGERHVTIGRGRDYEDVMPLRGVYHGDAEAALSVEVSMSQNVVTNRVPMVTVDQ